MEHAEHSPFVEPSGDSWHRCPEDLDLAAGAGLNTLRWSLLDNFEWMLGFAPTFGLVSVDRTTFARTPKPSLAWLGEVARRNGLA